MYGYHCGSTDLTECVMGFWVYSLRDFVFGQKNLSSRTFTRQGLVIFRLGSLNRVILISDCIFQIAIFNKVCSANCTERLTTSAMSFFVLLYILSLTIFVVGFVVYQTSDNSSIFNILMIVNLMGG